MRIFVCKTCEVHHPDEAMQEVNHTTLCALCTSTGMCWFRVVVFREKKQLLIRLPPRPNLSLKNMRYEILRSHHPFYSFHFTDREGVQVIGHIHEQECCGFDPYLDIIRKGDGSLMKPHNVYVQETMSS